MKRQRINMNKKIGSISKEIKRIEMERSQKMEVVSKN